MPSALDGRCLVTGWPWKALLSRSAWASLESQPRVTAWSLCSCRFPRLHSAVIRTFVLVQHYAAAMMAVSGLSQMKNYTSVETLEITQNLINSPKQCPCGHGLMVLLRVPCSPLAAVAYERLAHVRARLALEEHFEIILGNPTSGITIGKHFLKQLKVGTGRGRLLGGRVGGNDDQGVRHLGGRAGRPGGREQRGRGGLVMNFMSLPA